jgi:hypothetical protein
VVSNRLSALPHSVQTGEVPIEYAHAAHATVSQARCLEYTRLSMLLTRLDRRAVLEIVLTALGLMLALWFAASLGVAGVGLSVLMGVMALALTFWLKNVFVRLKARHQ